METYSGSVTTLKDALLVLEATRVGILPKIKRRLSDTERKQIKAGAVYVWDENEAGMRRWTDGRSWSASRVAGPFLTYREMEGRRENENSITTYSYKKNGLIKQSFSITTRKNRKLHLISYSNSYNKDPAVKVKHMVTPSTDMKLRDLQLPSEVYPENLLMDENMNSSINLEIDEHEKESVIDRTDLAQKYRQAAGMYLTVPITQSIPLSPPSPITPPDVMGQQLPFSPLTSRHNSLGSQLPQLRRPSVGLPPFQQNYNTAYNEVAYNPPYNGAYGPPPAQNNRVHNQRTMERASPRLLPPPSKIIKPTIHSNYHEQQYEHQMQGRLEKGPFLPPISKIGVMTSLPYGAPPVANAPIAPSFGGMNRFPTAETPPISEVKRNMEDGKILGLLDRLF